MAPALSADHATYRAIRNAKLTSELPLRRPVCLESSDFGDSGGIESCVPIVGAPCRSSLVVTVVSVICGASDKQMIRPDAFGIVAVVADEAFWFLAAVRQLKRIPVRPETPPMPSLAPSSAERAVAALICRALPFPATWSNFYERPEPLSLAHASSFNAFAMLPNESHRRHGFRNFSLPVSGSMPC